MATCRILRSALSRPRQSRIMSTFAQLAARDDSQVLGAFGVEPLSPAFQANADAMDVHLQGLRDGAT